MEFHHIGIPTQVQRDGEVYLDGAKLFVTPVEANPYQTEWLRFEADSPMPELLKTVPHIAYVVPNLDEALVGKEVLIPPFQPMDGLNVAFIVHDGAPVEFMQYA